MVHGENWDVNGRHVGSPGKHNQELNQEGEGQIRTGCGTDNKSTHSLNVYIRFIFVALLKNIAFCFTISVFSLHFYIVARSYDINEYRTRKKLKQISQKVIVLLCNGTK